MTSNINIYDKAIASLDDPILTKTYTESKIDFCYKMHTFLARAISLFNTPSAEFEKLQNALISPMEEESSVEADGKTTEFSLSISMMGKAIREVRENGKIKEDGYYFKNNEIVFNKPPMRGSKITVRQYYPGGFNISLEPLEETILALLLVSCWAEKEENFLLDIRRLLTTSDFKLNDSASVLRSKVNWHYTMYEQAQKLMNNYSLTLMKRKLR